MSADKKRVSASRMKDIIEDLIEEVKTHVGCAACVHVSDYPKECDAADHVCWACAKRLVCVCRDCDKQSHSEFEWRGLRNE